MSRAWIAFPLVMTTALLGCGSDPEPVTEVPPPNYEAEPEPLPPVSVNQGSTFDEQPTPEVTVGPDAGNAPAFEPEPLPPAQPQSRTYTIRKGDTLWSIAQRVYGDGQKWKDISAANPSIDPKKLAIGQEITLP